MDSAFNVIYSPSSVSDLNGIAEYLSNQLLAPYAAANLLLKIKNEIDRIALFPFSGATLKANEAFSKRYRWVKVSNYMVFYSTEESQNTVTIMRVLYASSDYLQSLQ